MSQELTRRQLLIASGIVAGSTFVVKPTEAAAEVGQPSEGEPIRYCLNTGTIRGQKLDLDTIVDVAAKAGYQGIEPWTSEIRRYAESGNKLSDLKKRIHDHSLAVESAIGFSSWIVDDPQQRAAAVESMRRDMDLLQQIGGKRIAASPAGAVSNMDLRQVARRYRDILEVGDKMGVTPQLELWGPSKTLSRLGELLFVAAESSHPSACLLPDVYHIYRGGSDFTGLNLVHGRAIHVFHMNDYPGDVPREKLTDADRVYPGDGTAPLGEILRTLFRNGFRGSLSLELFNRDYWKQDAPTVARTGLEKMRRAVQESLAS